MNWDFWMAMHRRMIQGKEKYGELSDDETRDKDIPLRAMKRKIQQYEKDGRVELLIDIANFAMIEFRLMGGMKMLEKQGIESETERWWEK